MELEDDGYSRLVESIDNYSQVRFVKSKLQILQTPKFIGKLTPFLEAASRTVDSGVRSKVILGSLTTLQYRHPDTPTMSKFGVLVMGPAGAGKVCAFPVLHY